MHIQTTHSRVPWSYPLRRSGGDGHHQTSWCLWLADPNKHDWGPVICHVCQLLPMIHQDFSHVAKPLHQLTKKRKAWRWTEAKQEAFEELKWLIKSTPIFVPPDQDAQFQLEMDASGYVTGAILSQLCKDNKWHLVEFTSKSLSDAERNYEIHDKELLAVIQGLEEWRHTLEGTQNTIEILNNHRNLTYFRTSKIWTTGKHASPYFWLGLTSLSSTGQGNTQSTWMPSYDRQTIWPRKDNHDWVMLSANRFSKSSKPSEIWQWMVMTLLMPH